MGCCGWQESTREPTVPQAPASVVVATCLAQAEADLAAATGGRPICRVGQERVAPVKQAEGRAAALAEVLRRIRRSTEAHQALSDTASAWRDAAERSSRLGPAWQSYNDGGLEALEALKAELERRGV